MPRPVQPSLPAAPVRFLPGTGALVKLLYLTQRVRGRLRYDDFVLERVQGTPILVMPSVFNPKRLRTGDFFASRLDSSLIGPEAEVLDLGTGSGVCALFAARHARRVVAVDINPAAVRCARINSMINRLDDRIEVRVGDLFAPVPAERFDLILFNPPFLRGEPRDDRDRAWRANGLAERFASDLETHLKPGGVALLLLSTFGDAAGFLTPLRGRGHRITPVAERRHVGERLTLFNVAPAGATESL